MTFEEFIAEYPLKLNEQQKEAVRTVDGPVLLLSAPGSGKTTVVVARLGYMVRACGIVPSDILTMTYTVASCNDMASRFRSMFGDELAGKIEFKTINATCVQILTRYASLTGKTIYEVISEDERNGFIKTAFKDVKRAYPTESDIKDVGSYITKAKNLLYDQDKIEELDWEIEEFPQIFLKYNELLKLSRKMDFDDQLTSAYKILKSKPQILEWIQDKYKYLMVDEAQDTSKVQHLIIRLITEKSRNLCMVADDDQSLYSWRGAYPQALLEFSQVYPEGKVLFMEQNFRCDGFIVDCADRFIQSNTLRYKKHIVATRDEVYPVQTKRFRLREEQYQFLAESLKANEKETAILYRYNESSIPIIDVLEKNGIRYNIRQMDLSFFTHITVTDICNIIKLAYDGRDTEAFLKIYYKTGFYLKKDIAELACRKVKSKEDASYTVFDAIDEIAGRNESIKDNCSRMRYEFDSLQRASARVGIVTILTDMGYGEYMKKAHMTDRKIGILKALGAGIKDPIGLVNRLDELKQIMTDKKRDDGARLTLTSIHSAKGLEWDSCMIADSFDGYFPENVVKNYKAATQEEISLYEEERRAYYVAATRAKNHLMIFTYDSARSTFTNQFLGLERASIPKEYASKAPAYRISKPAYEKKPVKKYSEAEYKAFADKLVAGATIVHTKFGSGRVVAKENKSVMINFSGSVKVFAIKTLFEGDMIKFS